MKNLFRQANVIFSGVLLIAFFMPWVNFSFFTLSGYEIPEKVKAINNVIDFFSKNNPILPNLYLSYALYLIPIFCTITIVRAIAGYGSSVFSFLGALTVIVLACYAYSQYGEVVVKAADIGLYTTVITAVILFFVSLPFGNAAQSNHNKYYDEIIEKSYADKLNNESELSVVQEEKVHQAKVKPKIGDWLKDNPGKTMEDYHSIYE